MAKIIAFGEYQNKHKQERFENKLQKGVEELEQKLGIDSDDEPLLVLTDMNAITIGNCLLDARNEINKVLDILGISETEVLPDGLE